MPYKAKDFPHTYLECNQFLARNSADSQRKLSALGLSSMVLCAALFLTACTSSGADPAPTNSSAPSTTVESNPDLTPSDEPTTDQPISEPTTESSSGESSSGERSIVWEPLCGEPWDPPELPLMEATDFELSSEDHNGDLWLTLEGEIRNLGPHWEGSYYTWPVMVQDDLIVSPMILGSDAIFDVSMEPASSVSVSGSHSLINFCGDGASSDPLPAGDYEIHFLVLDIAAYNETEERAVIAVFDSADVSMDENGMPVIP